MDDSELVRTARTGDTVAFTAIFDRHAARVHDLAFAMLRDRAAALEVVESTFLEASLRLHGLEEDHRLVVWLLAVTRRNGALRAGPTAGVDRQPQLPNDDPERAHLAGLVWEAVADLPLRDRTLLDLELRQGLDGHDLADALGVTLSQSQDLQARMRDRVEKGLSGYLIARTANGRCPDLAKVLKGWDGRFTPKDSRRIANHVDGCRVCNQARFSLPSPFALYAAALPAPFPAAVRGRVIERVVLPAAPNARSGMPPAPLAPAAAYESPAASWQTPMPAQPAGGSVASPFEQPAAPGPYGAPPAGDPYAPPPAYPEPLPAPYAAPAPEAPAPYPAGYPDAHPAPAAYSPPGANPAPEAYPAPLPEAPAAPDSPAYPGAEPSAFPEAPAAQGGGADAAAWQGAEAAASGHHPPADPSAAPDPYAVPDSYTAQDPTAAQDPYAVSDPYAAQSSYAVADTSATQDPYAAQDPSAVQNPGPDPYAVAGTPTSSGDLAPPTEADLASQSYADAVPFASDASSAQQSYTEPETTGAYDTYPAPQIHAEPEPTGAPEAYPTPQTYAEPEPTGAPDAYPTPQAYAEPDTTGAYNAPEVDAEPEATDATAASPGEAAEAPTDGSPAPDPYADAAPSGSAEAFATPYGLAGAAASPPAEAYPGDETYVDPEPTAPAQAYGAPPAEATPRPPASTDGDGEPVTYVDAEPAGPSDAESSASAEAGASPGLAAPPDAGAGWPDQPGEHPASDAAPRTFAPPSPDEAPSAGVAPPPQQEGSGRSEAEDDQPNRQPPPPGGAPPMQGPAKGAP